MEFFVFIPLEEDLTTPTIIQFGAQGGMMLFIAELGRVGKAETFLHLPEAGITNKLSKASSGTDFQNNHSARLGDFKEEG